MLLGGKIIVDKIVNIQSFSERWRKDFVDSMNPKFMPNGWNIKRCVTKS